MFDLREEKVRAYIYRVALAVGALFVAKGLITSDDLSLYLAVLVALLPTGLAAANTSTNQGPGN